MNHLIMEYLSDAQQRDYQAQAENYRLQAIGRLHSRLNRRGIVATVGRRLVQIGTHLQEQTEA